MSSQSSQESVLKAFEAGAKDYLIKPVRRNELATLWQHVWRVNRDLLPSNGSKTGSLPTKVKAYAGPDAALDSNMLPSPLHLLCEVASNEHQASSLQRLASREHTDANAQPATRHSSALSPVELKIRPLDVAPAHPSATRAAPGTLTTSAPQGNAGPHSMPAALRELAALGNKLERQRCKQAKSSDEDEQTAAGSDAANTLRHSESTSPFQSFTAFVPRPCSRGDAEEPPRLHPPSALQQMNQTHDPSRDSVVAACMPSHSVAVTAGQQQQFFQAFQAAVEQHQLAVEACAVNRRAAIAKFREKRKARNFNKKVCLIAFSLVCYILAVSHGLLTDHACAIAFIVGIVLHTHTCFSSQFQTLRYAGPALACQQHIVDRLHKQRHCSTKGMPYSCTCHVNRGLGSILFTFLLQLLPCRCGTRADDGWQRQDQGCVVNL